VCVCVCVCVCVQAVSLSCILASVNRCKAASTVTGHGLDRRSFIEFRSEARKVFIILKYFQTSSGTQKVSYSVCTGTTALD
jgi:hypothetical protein